MSLTIPKIDLICGKSCDICWEDNLMTVKCNWGCSICICRKCISEIMKISCTGLIYFKCPQCQKNSYNISHYVYPTENKQLVANIKFSRMCRKYKRFINKIFQLYENHFTRIMERTIQENYISEESSEASEDEIIVLGSMII